MPPPGDSAPIVATLRYDRLQVAGTIRLLVLHRSREHDPIATTLRSVHLHDTTGKNAFTALSYCWGDASHTYPIQCNGFVVRVAANLYSFLAVLRDRLNQEPDDQATMLLWVDALCINQADVDEKNAQVRLVADVYQRAASVYIWLGAPDETSQQAVLTFVEWSNVKTRLKGSGGATSSTRLTARTRDEFNHMFQADPWIESKMHAVSAFIRRPWFTRAWTFTEAVLARGSVLLWCGTQRLAWQYFVDAYEGLHRAGLAGRVFGLNPNIHTIVKWYLLLQKSNTTWNTGSISYMLQFGNFQEAADPRDKIYSLLGLLASTSIERASFVQNVCPVTYGLSVRDVYMRYAVLMMRHEKSLRTLSHCYRGRILPSSDLPSWVPDWRVPMHFRPLRKFGLPSDRDNDQDHGSAKVPSESPIHFVDPATNCLHVHGRPLATVAAIYDIYDDLPPHLDAASSSSSSRTGLDDGLVALRDLHASLDLSSPRATTPNTPNTPLSPGITTSGSSSGPLSRPPVRTASSSSSLSASSKSKHGALDFLATLCAGHLPRGLTTSPLSQEDERAEFPTHFAWEIPLGWRDEATLPPPGAQVPPAAMLAAAMDEAHAAMLGLPPRPARLRAKLRSALWGAHVSAEFLALPDVRARMAAEILRFARATVRGRVLFATSDGTLGLAPATARLGDRVYALRGWCLPFLLRPVGAADDVVAGATGDHVKGHAGKEYLVVGDVYLHGLEDIPGIETVLDDFRDGRVKAWAGKSGSSGKKAVLEEVVLV